LSSRRVSHKPFQHQLHCGGYLSRRHRVLVHAQSRQHPGETGHRAELIEQLAGWRRHAGLDCRALAEALGESAQIQPSQPRAERRGDGYPQQVRQYLVLSALLAHLELDLAAQRRDHSGQVSDPRDRVLLATERRPAQRRAGDRLRGGDSQSGRHPRALVDRAGLAKLARQPGDHLQHVRRNVGDTAAS
jgi:hypothetical protein